MRRLLVSFGVLVWAAAEMLLFAWLAGVIGWLWVLGILAAQFAIGVTITRRAGAEAFRRLGESARSGSLPGGEVGDSALLALGGVLLAFPTFLTDVPALLLMLPPTRGLARALGAVVLGKRIVAAGFSTTQATGYDGVTVTRLHEGSVVEGEVVERHDGPEGPPGPAIGPGEGRQ